MCVFVENNRAPRSSLESLPHPNGNSGSFSIETLIPVLSWDDNGHGLHRHRKSSCYRTMF